MAGLTQKEAFKLAAYQILTKREAMQREEGNVQASTVQTRKDMDQWLASHFWFWKSNTTVERKNK